MTKLNKVVLLLILVLCTQSLAKKEKKDKEEDENDVALPASCCGFSSPLLVKKDQWKSVFASNFGHISSIQIGDGCGGMGPYKIHSITLQPNTLLLPLLLHSDMVFFVASGSGIMNWVDEEARSAQIKRGDVYRLRPGSVFYLQSRVLDIFLGTELKIYAIFSNTEECLRDPCFGAYSSVTNLLSGFNESILKSAFGVPEEIIGLMRNRKKPPLIVQDMLSCIEQCESNKYWQLLPRLHDLFASNEIEETVLDAVENKKKKKQKTKKAKTFNIFESDPDFESPNGRTITLNTKDMKVLRGSTVGVYMVNLTQGSMMGPHWNPSACEISIALRGSGMVRVLRSSISRSSSKCKSVRFKIEEGDIFAVPRLHPMAQMSFINESLVFVGFTTSAKNNEPQFLAGRSSVLWKLNREVLAASLNVSNVMIDGILEARKEAVVLGCPFCAEGEFDMLKSEEEEKKWPPRPQPEPQPQPQPEPQPQPQPQPRPEPQPQPQPEPQPKPRPEPQPQPKPQPRPKPQPKPKPKPQPQPRPEPQPKPQPQPRPEPQPKPQPQPRPEPQPKPQPQPRPEPQPQPAPSREEERKREEQMAKEEAEERRKQEEEQQKRWPPQPKEVRQAGEGGEKAERKL